MSIVDYLEVCDKGKLIVKAAEEMAIPDLIDASKGIATCFEVQHAFLQQTSALRHDAAKVNEALQPTIDAIGALGNKCQAMSRGPCAEHARTLQEASAAFSWVTVQTEPHTFIKESMDSALYWGNKVRMAHKSKDPLHVEWVRAVQESLNALVAFAKTNYATGFQVSGSTGVTPTTEVSASSSKSAATATATATACTLEQVVECVQRATVASSSMDVSIQTLTDSFLQTVLEMGTLIETARTMPKPSDPLSGPLGPLTKRIEALQATCDTVRVDAKANIFAGCIRELIPCLSWVVVEDSPATFVKENADAADFHFNKILKDRESNQEKWVKALKEFVQKLILYVKAHHGSGLVWQATSGATQPAPGASSLFDELKRGTEITQGLRKVTDEQKVYKQKRAETTAGSAVSTLAERKNGKGWAPPAGKQEKKLVGNKKWMVEYFSGGENVTIDCEPHQVVFISRCQDTVIHITKKVNTISINECLRIQVNLMSTIGPVEVTNCESTDILYTHCVPSIAIEKCQETNIYVPEGSALNFEAVTSLSSNTNVFLPTLPEERLRNEEVQDIKCIPIPEQFVSKLNEKNVLMTSPTEHSCG